MGQVSDILNDPTWDQKSPLEKASARRDLFQISIKDNPEMADALGSADDAGKQAVYKAWQGKLESTFPEKFKAPGYDIKVDSTGSTELKQKSAPIYDATTEKILSAAAPGGEGHTLESLDKARKLFSSFTPEQRDAVSPFLYERYGDRVDSITDDSGKPLFKAPKDFLQWDESTGKKIANFVVPAALRMAPPILAATTKSAGLTAAAGALGGMGGQAAENLLGTRKGFRPLEMGVDSLLSVFPMQAMAKAEGGIMKGLTATSTRAAEGAAQGIASETGQQINEGKFDPNRLAGATLLGTGIGALLGGSEAGLSSKLLARLVGKNPAEIEAALPALAKEGTPEDAQKIADTLAQIKEERLRQSPEGANLLAGDLQAQELASAPKAEAPGGVVLAEGAPKSAEESAKAFEGYETPQELEARRANAEISAHDAANPDTPDMSAQAQRMADQYEGKGMYDRRGFVNPTFMGTITGGGAGFVAGSKTGDTPEERFKNAALYGVIGLAGGAALGRALGRSMAGKPVAEQIPLVQGAMAKADTPEVKAQLSEALKTLSERERIIQKYPELTNVPDGQLPVEIKGADGKPYPAVINGYWDIGLESGPVPSVGRLTPSGISHGMLKDGEQIISKVPTAEQWTSGVREIRTLPDNAQVSVMEMGGKKAVQVDVPGETPAARPSFSGSPLDAAKIGFDVEPIVKELPPGKYTVGGLRQAQSIRSTSGKIDPVLAQGLASAAGFGGGFAAGFEQDPNASPEERIKNGLMVGVVGAGAGYMLGHAFVNRPGMLGQLNSSEDMLSLWRRRMTPLTNGYMKSIDDLPNAIRERFATRFASADKLVGQIQEANPGLTMLKPYIRLSQQFDNVNGMFGMGAQAVKDLHDRVWSKVKPVETEAVNVLLALKRTGQRLQEDAKFKVEKARISQIPTNQWTDSDKAVMARPDDKNRVAKDTLQDVDRGLDQLRNRIGQKRFDELDQLAAGSLQQEFDNALQTKRDSGLISPKQYDDIKASNDFYTPFRVQQVADDWLAKGGSNSREVTDNMTHAITGIDSLDFRLDKTPIEASVDNIFNAQLVSEKNRKVMELAKYADTDASGAVIKHLQDFEQAPRGLQAVNYYRDGVASRLAIKPELAEAIKGMDSKNAGFVASVAMKLNQPYRVGATGVNLGFQSANAPWDLARLASTSKYGVQPTLKDWMGLRLPFDHVQSIFDVMRGQKAFSPVGAIGGFGAGYATAPDDATFTQKLERGAAGAIGGAALGMGANRLTSTPDIYRDFYKSGAAFSTVQDYLNMVSGRYSPEGVVKLATIPARSVLNTIEDLGKVIEESTKLTSFRRGVRMSDLESLSGQAKYQALQEVVAETRNFGGSPDFLRGGNWAKELNPIMPFFNPRIQGMSKDIGRLFGGDGAAAAAGAWTRLAPITLAATGLWYLNHRPENESDYAKRSDVEKEHYAGIPKYNTDGTPMYFTNERGQKVRDYWNIPLRDTGKMLYNLSEHAMDFANGKDPNAVKNAAVMLAEDISPLNISGNTGRERVESAVSSFGPMATIPYTLASGRNAFLHREVVPEVAGGPHDNMQKASPTEQFLPNTPEVYKNISQVLPQTLFDPLRSPLYLQTLTGEALGGSLSQFTPNKPVPGRDPLANTLSQNPFTRRLVGSSYTQPSKGDQQILQNVQQEGADANVERWRTVQDLVKRGPTMAPNEKLAALKQMQADPRLARSFVNALKRGSLGMDATEYQVSSASASERAAFIFEKVESLPVEARAKYLSQPWIRKAMTPETQAELAKHIQMMQAAPASP